MKTCSRCGYKGEDALFLKGRNICRECNKKYKKAWYAEHKESWVIYSEKHKEERAEYFKKRYAQNKERISEVKKAWRTKNCLRLKLKSQKYLKTPAGKIGKAKRNAKRRKLGYKPINKWFKGAEAHHLRYSRNPNEQDNDITLYVPRELHKSIWHNGNTGQGMREINIACLEWYLAETPEDERHPKAVKLYWNYCTLPEPTWSENK
ncbi:MAG: hypothetical protein PHN69_06085 [Candidatus Pacebacteria bacterium]|nr:hypothetical protein [Candidatus Paceibacterota bacterium]